MIVASPAFVQLSATSPSLPVAVSPVGFAGVVSAEASSDSAPAPDAFRARTLNAYVTPPDSPVTV